MADESWTPFSDIVEKHGNDEPWDKETHKASHADYDFKTQTQYEYGLSKLTKHEYGLSL